MMMNDRVILWDIDGTILESSLEKTLLRYLLDQKHISLPLITANALRLTLKLPFPKLYQYKLYYLAGKNADEVERWIQECWNQRIKPALRPGAVELMREIEKRHCRQVALSGTFAQLAQPLIDELPFTDLIAGNPKIRRNVFTGGLTGPHPRGYEKVAQAAAWLERTGFNWERTIAIADHWDDRFLLTEAGSSFAFSPDTKLRAFAKAQRIPIADSMERLAELLIPRLTA